MMRRRLSALILAASLLAGVAAPASAEERGFFQKPIAGLVDGSGQPIAPEAVRGRNLLVFFGYTHCPDVCPTSLYEITAALDLLDPAAQAKVRPVFVSVDPARDTPEVMSRYLSPLKHDFLAITGTVAAADELAWTSAAVAIRHDADGGDYLVDHTSGVTLYDGTGKVVERFPYSMDYKEVARRLAVHLAAPQG